MNWGTKYRPEEYNQIALKPEIRRIFDKVIKEQKMGDFLFHSPDSGIGKTSLALIIPKAIKHETLMINASKDGNVNTINTKIMAFMDYKPGIGMNGKTIILDEADRISHQAQESLRGILESVTSKDVNFIFTCNDKSKLIKAISKSRLFDIDFTLPVISNDDDFKNSIFNPIVKYIISILKSNDVQFDIKNVIEFVKFNYSIYQDIRKMIVILEYSIFDNVFEFSKENKIDIEPDNFLDLIKNKNDEEIFNFGELEYKNAILYMNYISRNIKKDFNSKFMEITSLINDFQYKNSNNLMLEKINFIDFLYKLKLLLN